MPAHALEVDKEQVKIVALQVGVREAARQFGIAEATVQAWSAREQWFKEREQQQALVQQAVAIKRERQGLQPKATTAAEILANYSGNTRLKLAHGLNSAAEHVATMDGQEVLMASQQVAQLTGAAAKVHGWQQNVAVGLVDLRNMESVDQSQEADY